ncbi:hypothetical protein LL033_24795 (plasmid) [Clostridium estertheticum]|uniref:hypothetical protein n=1 Tax=Clostridium estertheticum TaxID=238834 RepID=UPI001C0B98CE|nr:hypothetical protein [Clostridium estertheticum]MBU3217828.1 hypothetical protein [Clostridium estertheticum]WAG58344.1 hypothetical protein LL033_24795 [Clostridium estertheticum]
MQNKTSMSNISNGLSIISLVIPTVILILILNWLFKITPFQRLEGFAVMVTPFICPIAIILAIVSRIICFNKFWKISIIFNVILIPLPFLFW